jgi:hypothetical protein
MASRQKTVPHNLPVQLTSFVGRVRGKAEIRELLTENRLLTLTGSAGSGKTRLALETAGEVLDITGPPNAARNSTASSHGGTRRGLVRNGRPSEGVPSAHPRSRGVVCVFLREVGVVIRAVRLWIHGVHFPAHHHNRRRDFRQSPASAILPLDKRVDFLPVGRRAGQT